MATTPIGGVPTDKVGRSTTKKPLDKGPFGPLPETAKRVVIQHTCGPMKGLFRIFGTVIGNPAPALPGPSTIGDDGHIIQGASLILVKPRYVLYREFADFTQIKGKFGGGMPEKNFHPDQV